MVQNNQESGLDQPIVPSSQGSGPSVQGILGSGSRDGEGIWWISNGQFYEGESLGGAFITDHGYRSWNFKKIKV